MSNKGWIEEFWEKLFNFPLFSLRFLCVFFRANTHALPCICCNALHYACNGIYGSREGGMCNKGMIESF